MKNNIKVLAGIALLAITAGMLSRCSSISAKESEQKPTTAPAAREVFKLQKQKFATKLKIPGELTAYRQVDLYAKENSYVKTCTLMSVPRWPTASSW